MSRLTSRVTLTEAGDLHSCALTTSGVAAIVAGDEHTCALLTGGGMKCWGKNSSGQLGNNSTTSSSTPVEVSSLTSGVAAIAAGENHTCAVTTGGAAKCWGSNSFGQLGDGTTTLRKTPVNVSGLTSGVASMDGGEEHTCARTTAGGVKCWGRNQYGQLGDGTTTDRLTPVNVSGLTSGVTAIATRNYHTCAQTSGGGARCWGDDYYGQLGDGFGFYSTAPVSILLGSGTNYTYGSTSHKHAVTALGTGESYAYDANGNMTTRVEGGLTYTQTFNAENRLISVTVNGQTTHFIYDGDGNLIKKVNPNGSKTLYVGGIYEIDKNSTGGVEHTKTYYPAGGAMRIDNTLYYVLKDHLGSASVVTDATSGTIVGEARFYPFGGTRFTTGTMYTDKLFTGQREMADLGIYHYGARFYSPYINRFVSADTIVPGYANPQNLNRYSYVTNNPLRYTDPTGHYCVEENGGNIIRVDCDSSEPIGGGGGGNGGGGHDDDDDEDYCSTHPASCGLPPAPAPIITLPAEGGANVYNCFTNPSACLYNAATVTQNIATLIDIPFAIVEGILIVGECIAAPLAGCVTGAFMGQAVFNLTGANGLETVFSSVSFALTVAADAFDDRQLGEASGTSLVTFLAGGLMFDPIGDVIIDGYASGYNNGTFNGISTLMNGGPLVIPK